MNWAKIFTNDATDRGLISKIYKQTAHQYKRKTDALLNQTLTLTLKNFCSIKKWVEDINRYFSKLDIQMANRNMKRCSILLFYKMQIKTTMKPHFTPVRMANI